VGCVAKRADEIADGGPDQVGLFFLQVAHPVSGDKIWVGPNNHYTVVAQPYSCLIRRPKIGLHRPMSAHELM
jgi:hypothetical protein